MLFALAVATALASPETDVRALLTERCHVCHSSAARLGELDLEAPLPIGRRSAASGRILIDPGKPGNSYLVDKISGAEGIVGEPMPLGMPPLTAAEVDLVRGWISELDPAMKPASETSGPPFAGTHQISLHTATTLGRHTMGFRVHHRFGRFGKPRGFGGLDEGAVMSLGLSYGIIDGWDLLLRRSNSNKDYELGTKFVPLRQEDGLPLSLGVYASVEYLDEPGRVVNRWVGNTHLLAGRQVLSQWSAGLVVGWSSGTNHTPELVVERGKKSIKAEDSRASLGLGALTTVWFDRRRAWGLDAEYLWPVRGGEPDTFYYRGGDADPDGATIGHWGLGFSNHIGLHVFQVMLTNNREIHTNLVAPGGQLGNPVGDGGNFYLGFNLSRWWRLPRKGGSQ